jgi:hypothetical protein
MYEASRELNKEQGLGLSLPTHASVSAGTSKIPLLNCHRDVMGHFHFPEGTSTILEVLTCT